MIEKFNYSWVLKPARPHDFAALKEDLEYLSLLRTTREITSFKRERSKDLLEQALRLQENIKAELEGGGI